MKFLSAAPAAFLLLLQACVSFPGAPAATTQPRLTDERVVSVDGAALGLSVWKATDPIAVIVAVHGMNDYARAFEPAGEYWAAHGVMTYAYDQRGFGRSLDFGHWPGEPALIADLNAVIAAVHKKNPQLPVYVVAHSMGAGVVMAAAVEGALDVDGAVLAAPGVWGGSQLPLLYRAAANISASLAPGKTLTGEGADRQATDNIEILRQMYDDPYVIKPTRLDAILGVARLMGSAYDASDEIGGNVLFLYGLKDEIIPIKSMQRAAGRLCGAVDVRSYENGWHMLFVDLQAEKVWRDVASWIEKQNAAANGMKGFGPAANACSAAAS